MSACLKPLSHYGVDSCLLTLTRELTARDDMGNQYAGLMKAGGKFLGAAC